MPSSYTYNNTHEVNGYRVVEKGESINGGPLMTTVSKSVVGPNTGGYYSSINSSVNSTETHEGKTNKGFNILFIVLIIFVMIIIPIGIGLFVYIINKKTTNESNIKI